MTLTKTKNMTTDRRKKRSSTSRTNARGNTTSASSQEKSRKTSSGRSDAAQKKSTGKKGTTRKKTRKKATSKTGTKRRGGTRKQTKKTARTASMDSGSHTMLYGSLIMLAILAAIGLVFGTGMLSETHESGEYTVGEDNNEDPSGSSGFSAPVRVGDDGEAIAALHKANRILKKGDTLQGAAKQKAYQEVINICESILHNDKISDDIKQQAARKKFSASKASRVMAY